MADDGCKAALGGYRENADSFARELSKNANKRLEYVPPAWPELTESDMRELWLIDKQAMDVHRNVLNALQICQSKLYELQTSFI